MRLWVRATGASSFGAVCSPGTPVPARVASLESLPPSRTTRGSSLEHAGTEVGLLEARMAVGERERETLRVVCHILAPYLASLELSEDLAGEVAAQSREIEEQRRFTSLIIDSLPLGLYVVDRDYRIQIWNRKRETGTQGLRRDEVVGRPVFEVLTRQPPGQLRAEFDRVFQTGEIQQNEQEVTLGDEVHYFRLSKIPMRLDGDAITHVITIGEDVTDSRAVQGRIMQSGEAGGDRPARRRGHARDQQPARHHQRLRRGDRRASWRTDRRPRPRRESTSRSSTGKSSAAARSSTGCSTSAGPRASARRRVPVTSLVDETLFLLKHHQRFKRVDGGAGARRRTCRAILGNTEQLIQVLMALMLNAVDAMEPGGPAHGARRQEAQRGDEVVVEIEDTGIGIPRERPVEDLRALLHHQAAGPRHRARPVDLLRHRGGPPRPDRGGQHARAGAPPSGSSCRSHP